MQELNELMFENRIDATNKLLDILPEDKIKKK